MHDPHLDCQCAQCAQCARYALLAYMHHLLHAWYNSSCSYKTAIQLSIYRTINPSSNLPSSHRHPRFNPFPNSRHHRVAQQPHSLTSTTTIATMVVSPSILSSVALSLLLLLLFSSASSTVAAVAANPPNCPPGHFWSSLSHRCVVCRPGHYSWGGNFKSCLPCPTNTFTPFRGVVDISLCLPCPSSSVSSPGSSCCIPRRRSHNNRYTHLSSSSWSSFVAQSLKLSSAMKCNGKPSAFWITPPKGVSYLSDSMCVSPVTGCPRGTRLKLWARRAVCVAKRSGKVLCGPRAVFDSVDRCVSCAEGNLLRRGTRGSARKWRCELCPPGSVSKGGVVRQCKKCPCGYAKSADGTTCIRTIPPGVTIKC